MGQVHGQCLYEAQEVEMELNGMPISCFMNPRNAIDDRIEGAER